MSVLASDIIDNYHPLKADSTFDTWSLGGITLKANIFLAKGPGQTSVLLLRYG